MGLEGAVRLGWRKELEAAAPGPEREALFQRLLAAQVQAGGAVPLARKLEIDAVIDPADTRAWLARALQSARVAPLDDGVRFIDTW
jgi:acetyl-CoA carboxylase carboxyltransferase component